MKPKLIALNLLLVLAIAAIGWQARERWREAQVKRRENLNVAAKPIALLPPAPAQKPEGAQAIKYADVATKNLFSKDRNPAVIIDPPKIEKPKVMPPLPVIYGILGLPSGTKAIMAESRTAESRPVQKGDTVGEFKIVSLDPTNVVFDWDGQQISRKIDDLIDRSGTARAAAASAGTPPPSVQQPVGPAVALPVGPAAPPPIASSSSSIAAGPGKASPGQSDRPCIPGESSPVGTVVDGFRKASVITPFGAICHWVAIQ